MKVRPFVLACVVVLFVNNTATAQDTCCARTVATTPIWMPEAQDANCSGALNGAINMVLTERFAEMDDCPVMVSVMDFAGVGNINRLLDKMAVAGGSPKSAESSSTSECLDYLINSTLSLLKTDEIEEGEWETGYEGRPNWVPGNVYGTWELKVDLVDSARGTVVRSGSTTWRGNCLGDSTSAVVNLINTRFMPLDDIMFDYERIPDAARVVPAAPRIEVGTEATFSITGIKDQEGRRSAPFQRLMVLVDEGRVVNGFDKDPYKVFEVGPSGTVQIRYRAPDECVDQTATLEVYNSCNINDGLNSTLPENRLAGAEIHIHCTPKWRWRGTLSLDRTLDYHCGHTWEEGTTGREILARDMTSATGVISLGIREGVDPPEDDLDESDMRLGGSIFLLQDKFDEQWWRDPTGFCWNGRRNAVVTPGPWVHKTNSWILQRTCTVANAGLSLGFTDLTPEEEASVVQEMAGGSVPSSLSSGEGARGTGADYVRVIVLLGLECNQKVKVEAHDFRHDRCEGSTEDEGGGNGFITIPTFSYMGQLEGTINRKKNGEATIEAVGAGAQVIADGYPEFTVWGCPARVTVKDNTKLFLERRRIR